jgi:hypothetical protein
MFFISEGGEECPCRELEQRTAEIGQGITERRQETPSASRQFHVTIALKVKLKLSLCLTKYHALNMYQLLHKSAHHEDVGWMEE